MKSTDKNLIKESVRISGSVVLATVNPSLIPAWELSLAVLGAVIDRRNDKAQEWLNLFVDNKEKFSDAVINNPSFQDAFVNSFELYLRERNKEKRLVMKSIFVDFSKSQNLEEYPLEKYYFVLNTISIRSLRLLSHLRQRSEEKDYFQVENNSFPEFEQTSELINELLTLNILTSNPNARWGPVENPSVRFSVFGKEFIQFIKE